MKKIAIIGACGYIGKHLVKYLRDNYNIEPILMIYLQLLFLTINKLI